MSRDQDKPVVAIDGPAGAGKSTVAKLLADELGYLLVDTGAIYRVVALAAQGEGVPWSDAAAMGAVAERLVSSHSIRFERSQGTLHVYLGDKDVTDAIRKPEIGMAASAVSAHGRVRDALLELQRDAGRKGGVVLEGRDIGTVVFPDAEVKVFLTASVETRSRRRFDELTKKGESVSFESVLADVQKRDDQDTNRAHAPLAKAADAHLVDSTAMSLEETVQAIAALVRARTRS